MVLDSFQLSGVVPVSHMSTNSLCMAWCMLGGRCFSSSIVDLIWTWGPVVAQVLHNLLEKTVVSYMLLH